MHKDHEIMVTSYAENWEHDVLSLLVGSSLELSTLNRYRCGGWSQDQLDAVLKGAIERGIDQKQVKADTDYLVAFAQKHKLIFDDEGECGIGRECVGIRHGNSWVDYNPREQVNYEQIPDVYNKDLQAPEGVDAYHKHECLAVLGRGDSAVIQLATWIRHIESLGTVEIKDYATGATGMQSGVLRPCITIGGE